MEDDRYEGRELELGAGREGGAYSLRYFTA